MIQITPKNCRATGRLKSGLSKPSHDLDKPPALFLLKRLYRLSGFLVTLLLPLLLSRPLIAGDFVDQPKVQSLIKELSEKHAFKEQVLIDIFTQAEHKQSIIDAMTRPAEKTKTWGEYRDIFISTSGIKNGVKFWEKHRTAIQKASEQYGIPPEIIVAIIGVETRYGQNRGSYRVIDALSTLAFNYPPRSRFFYKELKEYLILSQEAGLDVLTTKGSYAGAMGYPQFIPSSYRNYAIDFDNNGSIDLVNSPEDAIGSVANYFDVHGWVTDEEVLLKATPQRQDTQKNTPPAPLNLDKIANNSLSPNITIADIESHGLKVLHPEHIDTAEKGVLMELQGKQGIEHWVGLHNFYVITRYNHSRLYAMAVYQLSQAIKAKI